MYNIKRSVIILFLLAIFAPACYGARLAIVIDDVGYRPANEIKLLALSTKISVAVLPDSPHAREMAERANQGGHDVLIHLPMAPLSKQPLEKETLTPDMSEAEVQRIIARAISKVPYAQGINNHMGSAMTQSLPGMQKVLAALAEHQFFFLDSKTTAKTQSVEAAKGTGVTVLARNIFLDDVQEDEAIREQFYRAINHARRYGTTIAIGHPHPQTVRVLQQELANLPDDIQLVSISTLLPNTEFDQRLLSYCENTTPLKHTGLISLFELF